MTNSFPAQGAAVIRPAVLDDAPALACLGAAFFVETGMAKRGLEFDPDSFLRMMEALSRDGILLVAVVDGAVVGAIGAGVLPAWWNTRTIVSQELLWYVSPQHRKGVGRKLIEAFEAEAIARGARLIGMSAEQGLRSTALNRLYRQRGYSLSETMFWKDCAA